jgi:hypothetical protein
MQVGDPSGSCFPLYCSQVGPDREIAVYFADHIR